MACLSRQARLFAEPKGGGVGEKHFCPAPRDDADAKIAVEKMREEHEVKKGPDKPRSGAQDGRRLDGSPLRAVEKVELDVEEVEGLVLFAAPNFLDAIRRDRRSSTTTALTQKPDQ
jgi:hypothetical protein